MNMSSQLQNGVVTILVTGIGGFLGGHIARQLLAQGYCVRGSVRRMGHCDKIRDQVCPDVAADGHRISFIEADLRSDAGWDAAVAGCRYVIHSASPFPSTLPKDEDDLIRPAREGALRVLRAAQQAGTMRVVMTSSIAATNHGNGQAPYTEDDWTDPTSLRATPYYKSKTLAERAAWAFADETGLDLVVINPGIIFGPLLGPDYGTSVGLIQQMMSGKLKRVPRFGVAVVDVRDAADAHIRAMTHPEASGERFIAAGKFFWMRDMAAALANSFPDYASQLPSGEVPNWVVRMMAPFSARSRMIVHELDRDLSVCAAKATRVLGWQPRPEKEAICASAQSLIDHGLIAAS
ncbi:aldehyde reductase [Bradyrhizobium sp. AUGA SZCCT0240]|nr:aldehyde reductase [Bradyrhizobium sp. AUGA SZCCT0158]MBR1245267.1 aldehyde reductase [Bradyrhizobium sp. AUGA SZCCT0274]MBR1252488.1 aldehyde reductase [Bradyrhizobium sp. AUGA SZCCT0240]